MPRARHGHGLASRSGDPWTSWHLRGGNIPNFTTGGRKHYRWYKQFTKLWFIIVLPTLYICICIRIYIYICVYIYIYCKYEYVSKPWYPRYHKIAGLWMVYPQEHGKKGFDPSPYKGRTCIITLVCRGT